MPVIPSEIVGIAGIVDQEPTRFAWARLHFEEATREAILHFRDAALEHRQTDPLVAEMPHGQRRVVNLARVGIDEDHHRAPRPTAPAHCDHTSCEVRPFGFRSLAKNTPALLDAIANACTVHSVNRIGNLRLYRPRLEYLVRWMIFKPKGAATSLREGACFQETPEHTRAKHTPPITHDSILAPLESRFHQVLAKWAPRQWTSCGVSFPLPGGASINA